MNFKKLVVSIVTGALLVAAAVPAFAYSSVSASGSSAILPLAKTAAEFFMNNNPTLNVSVSGGGSFTGLKQVSDGAVQIGNSDVPAGADYPGLVPHKVAVAPFLIIVNPANKVSSLTQQQLSDIFTGKITNWKEVGGNDEKITIAGRASTSGSRATIKTIVLEGKEFTDSALVLDSTGAVRTSVGTTTGAIGYVDAAYLNDSIKALKYNGVAYTDENVIAGKYPVWTYEYMFTKGEATGVTKQFIDFVLETSFQNTFVDKLGFIAMSKMEGKKAETEVKVTPAPVKKPVVQAPAKKVLKAGTIFVSNGKFFKKGANGKDVLLKNFVIKSGTVYYKNGAFWKRAANGKDYYIKK